MKNKVILVILIVLILILGIFFIIGLGKNKNSNENQTSSINSVSNNASSKLDKQDFVNQLQYRYSSNANIKDSTNGKIIENENYKIIISHQKNKTSEEIANSRNLSFINTDKINNTEWKKYNYNDEQVSSVIYMYERDNGTYLITFTNDAGVNISLDKEIEEFMNNVRFE